MPHKTSQSPSLSPHPHHPPSWRMVIVEHVCFHPLAFSSQTCIRRRKKNLPKLFNSPDQTLNSQHAFDRVPLVVFSVYDSCCAMLTQQLRKTLTQDRRIQWEIWFLDVFLITFEFQNIYGIDITRFVFLHQKNTADLHFKSVGD